jgi:large subunit ribosomal protein L5
MSFKENYYKKIVPELQKELSIKNINAVPRVEKIVINVGVGEAITNKNVIEKVSNDLSLISGQKPQIALARKSVAAFKIRKGVPIGVKVTLRNKRMYIFLEKFLKIVLPRIRDFRGISPTSFDGRGNLNIGLTDQTLFPEIEYDKIDKIRGLEITIVTNSTNDEHSKKLMEKLGLVFMNQN